LERDLSRRKKPEARGKKSEVRSKNPEVEVFLASRLLSLASYLLFLASDFVFDNSNKQTLMHYRRRIVREKVLQALYAHELSQEPIDKVIDDILSDLKRDDGVYRFACDLIKKIIEQQDTIDRHIQRKVANWEFNRIAVIDRLVLRMGICEILYFPDIPPKVSINEAIEVAKKYSTADSGKFVNGVLDSLLDELKAQGQLSKSGRGLVDHISGRKERSL
jgi:N utilization substance protein B